MQLPADNILEESKLVEDQLSSLLSRVAHRLEKTPAAEADGHINQVMYKSLRDSLKLTREFSAAIVNKYPYTQQGVQLRALANNLASFQLMIESLEGDRGLSTFFERVIDREYKELTGIRTHFHSLIKADSDRISALTREEILAAERPLPLPLVVGFCLLMIPVVIMGEILKGTAKGLQPEPAPKASHLKLVHNT